MSKQPSLEEQIQEIYADCFEGWAGLDLNEKAFFIKLAAFIREREKKIEKAAYKKGWKAHAENPLSLPE